MLQTSTRRVAGTVRVRRLGPGTFTVPVWTHSLSSLDSTVPFFPRRYRFSELCGSFPDPLGVRALIQSKARERPCCGHALQEGPWALGALLWPFSDHAPPMGGGGVYMPTGYTPPLACILNSFPKILGLATIYLEFALVLGVAKERLFWVAVTGTWMCRLGWAPPVWERPVHVEWSWRWGGKGGWAVCWVPESRAQDWLALCCHFWVWKLEEVEISKFKPSG